MRGIAIVGAHSATKLGAPYGDSDWKIWSLSPKNESELPRADIWFELHKRFLSDPDADGLAYGAWLRSRPVVYMQSTVPAIPGSVPYPKDAIVANFGTYFLNSSLAWMMAMAIHDAPDAIGIWGIAADAAEYREQRTTLRHFALVARHVGIAVTAPGCPLLDDCPLYGYDNTN